MKTITLRTDAQGTTTLTLDMPGRSWNVWNTESIADFAAAVDQISEDDGCKGVIITSGKPGFLAGADLAMVEALTQGGQDAATLSALVAPLSDALRRLETCGKPVVAAINGTALGGGFELALACHHLVLVDSPRAKVGPPEF